MRPAEAVQDVRKLHEQAFATEGLKDPSVRA